MKLIMVMASIFSALLGMVSRCQKPSEEVSVMLMEPQGEEIRNALGGVTFKMEGRVISVGSHWLEVLPYVEQCMTNESSHVCGVRFEILNGGKKDPTMMYAVVG